MYFRPISMLYLVYNLDDNNNNNNNIHGVAAKAGI